MIFYLWLIQLNDYLIKLQLGEIKVKNEEMIFELNCSVECAKSLQERFNVQVEVNNQLRGESSSIDVLDLVQIVELEKILRQSLQAVEVKKVRESNQMSIACMTSFLPIWWSHKTIVICCINWVWRCVRVRLPFFPLFLSRSFVSMDRYCLAKRWTRIKSSHIT